MFSVGKPTVNPILTQPETLAILKTVDASDAQSRLREFFIVSKSFLWRNRIDREYGRRLCGGLEVPD